MLNCRKFAREPSWVEFFSKADLSLSADWSGAPLSYPFFFHLGISPTRLYFGASADIQTSSKPGTAAGGFVEGLWEHDVLEFFLTSIHTESYQEFNLAPNGSWGTATFSGYRQRSSSKPNRESCNIFAQASAARFMTGLSIALEEIAVPWGNPGETRIHLAAIMSNPTRTFLSSSPNPSGSPDFHLREGFQAFNLVEDEIE